MYTNVASPDYEEWLRLCLVETLMGFAQLTHILLNSKTNTEKHKMRIQNLLKKSPFFVILVEA